MAAPLHLEIVTPDKLLLSKDVDYVSAPGFEGEFGVLPGHIPYVSALRPGVLSYWTSSVCVNVFVSGGFAEVKDNKVTVLAESAELAGDIDLGRAERARERAEQRLAQARAGEAVDVVRAEAALQRAIKRINMLR